MTKREFLQMVIADTTNAEIKAYAEAEIQKMDEANKKKASHLTETQKENIVLLEKIETYMQSQEDFLSAGEIGSVFEISVQKASALLRKLEKDGKVEVADVKRKSGSKGSMRKVKGYKIIR